MVEVTLRPATGQDTPFLRELFISAHPEYEQLPLPPEQKRQLVEMQFHGQAADYTARFPASQHDIILYGGRPAGRIWVARTDHEIRVLDISLAPEARNTGIGSYLIQALQVEAAQSGKRLASVVMRFNEGSLRWHQRLGFTLEHEDPFCFHMEWRAPAMVD